VRLLLILLASACALALLAAPASAATNATSDGTRVTVSAAPDVANDVTVEPGDAPGTVRITDGADAVSPSAGCATVTAATVQCTASGTVEVDLGDRDDRLSARVAVEADGGDGDDTFAVANATTDTLHCGPGRDDASDADAQDAADADCEETLATAGPPDTSVADGPATFTRQTAATFAFGATEPATFECSLDGATFAACSSTPTYTGLAEGDHELRVRAVDGVGKTDPVPAAYAFTVDTSAPAIAFSSTPGATTNRATAGFAFAAADPSATVECRLDAAGWAPCASPTAMQYAGLADGAHTVTVRATDPAGNAGEVAWTWTQDTVRPQTLLTSGPASTIPVTSGSATLTFAAQGGDRFECSLDGGAWSACASPVAYAGLANGTHTFAVRAVDAAGNVDGTPSTRTWTVSVDGAPTARVFVRRDGDGFVLDSGRSSDPDGGALTYRWTRNGAAAGTGATVRYAAPGEATRDVFTVTATDAGGLRGVASVALRTRATTETAPHEALEVIRFAGGTRLASGAAPRIAALRPAIAAAGARVRVEGFSRRGGNAADVARARARIVRGLLARGAPRARITAVGRGSAGATASNATAAGRARNDRVVVTVAFRAAAERLVTEVEDDPAISWSNAPQPVSAATGAAPKLFAFFSNVPGGLRRLEEVGARVDVLAPNWYTLSPVGATVRGGRPNARVMALSRQLGFAVWPVVNATMRGSALIDTPAGRAQVVARIGALAARYHLDGVTLDMEEMEPRQKASFSALARELASALHARHRKLAIYAVRRTATEVDDSAAAYDWLALAAAADLVLASGYNEHAATTTPGPVTTRAGFAGLAAYAAATSRTKVAPVMGAFGYTWGGAGATMLSSAAAERRWPVRAETGSADGRSVATGSARAFFESAEDLWAREREARRAGARWIGLFTLGREPDRFWERSAIR
jgi:hypothetical protein